MSDELQVLANYVGVWDASVPAAQITGEIAAKWVLQDRFVLTYDQRLKVYRMISFMSNGMIGEADATWDP